jgi:hypothetical protein
MEYLVEVIIVQKVRVVMKVAEVVLERKKKEKGGLYIYNYMFVCLFIKNNIYVCMYIYIYKYIYHFFSKIFYIINN